MLDNDGWASAQTMARLDGVLPFIDAEMEKLKLTIVGRARTAQMSANGLSPDLAVSLWAEYLSADGLIRRMTQRVRATAAEADRALTKAHLPGYSPDAAISRN